ncbi:hypothetical protein QEO77_gp01 [Arthrobacter phage Zaheer]|uniref:Uncharacterized protein n=1 Tax=Arthrobacter phage Zaheer TaxID=2836041 RepID=A0A8F3ILP0_9CAUD|nr:hypothetical protein QEO77_gp01 [Arthrobacter phage Zaheer]QWY84202.1 hypothetical protein SEA_ZAHEER_1 [Arthrobacter phage Zaheer]
MAATLGTMTAKVLIQIGDGEPIEVGVMDIDLIPKQKPVMRGSDFKVNVKADLDAEATAQGVYRRFQNLGSAL